MGVKAVLRSAYVIKKLVKILRAKVFFLLFQEWQAFLPKSKVLSLIGAKKGLDRRIPNFGE